MKRILGLIGSPRKLGNCEVFTKELCRQLGEEHELRLLRLSELDIQPCRGCYRCLYGAKCPIDDDLQLALEALAEADAYIVAVPAYFLSANSSLKRLLDRGLSFYGVKERLWGKPSLALGFAGIEGKEGTTLLQAQSFLKCLLSDIKASATIYAALPGEVFFEAEGLAAARRLAGALFGEAIAGEGPRCPLCGGNSFSFMGALRARCLLCGNEGDMSIEGGEPVFDIRKGGHELFLDREAAIAHEAWLKKMKEDFMAGLPRIRKVREEYNGPR